MMTAQDGQGWIALTPEVFSQSRRLVDHCHAMALKGQPVGGGESRRPGANHDD